MRKYKLWYYLGIKIPFHRIQYFYEDYITTISKGVGWGLLISLLIYFSLGILNASNIYFTGETIIGRFLEAISIAYIAAFIFYIITVHIPSQKEHHVIMRNVKDDITRLLGDIDHHIEMLYKQPGLKIIRKTLFPTLDDWESINSQMIKNRGWDFGCKEMKSKVNSVIDRLLRLHFNDPELKSILLLIERLEPFDLKEDNVEKNADYFFLSHNSGNINVYFNNLQNLLPYTDYKYNCEIITGKIIT